MHPEKQPTIGASAVTLGVTIMVSIIICVRCGPRYGREATRKRQAAQSRRDRCASAPQCYRGAAIADRPVCTITIGPVDGSAPIYGECAIFRIKGVCVIKFLNNEGVTRKKYNSMG